MRDGGWHAVQRWFRTHGREEGQPACRKSRLTVASCRVVSRRIVLTALTPSAHPQIGAIITYRFQELSQNDVPRFPTFVGERADADEPKDAVVRSAAAREAEASSGGGSKGKGKGKGKAKAKGKAKPKAKPKAKAKASGSGSGSGRGKKKA